MSVTCQSLSTCGIRPTTSSMGPALKVVSASGGPFPSNPTLTTTGVFGGPLKELSPGQKRLQAALILQINSPMQGYTGLGHYQIKPRITVAGLESVVIGPSRSLFSTSPGSPGLNGVVSIWTRTNYNRDYSGNNGFRLLMMGSAGVRTNGWRHNDEQFPTLARTSILSFYQQSGYCLGQRCDDAVQFRTDHHSDLASNCQPADYSHSDLQRFLSGCDHSCARLDPGWAFRQFIFLGN